mgnify:CR=1 FL=1
MKSRLVLTISAAAALTGISSAQITAHSNPLGFTTQKLAANQQNLVGINLMTPVIASGSFTAVSGATISDGNANFSRTIATGKMAVLEITSGAAAGTVQDFATWSEDSITLPATVTGLAVGNTYKIRLAPTLQEIFPPGMLTGALSASSADKVWIPSGAGAYSRYWYKTGNPAGWRSTSDGSNDTGAVTADVPLLYIDGIVVETSGLALPVPLVQAFGWPVVPEAKLKTPRLRKLTSVSKPPSWLKPKPRLFVWLVFRKPVFSCMFCSCGIFMLCGSCSRLALMITPSPPVGSWWQMLQLVAAPGVLELPHV